MEHIQWQKGLETKQIIIIIVIIKLIEGPSSRGKIKIIHPTPLPMDCHD